MCSWWDIEIAGSVWSVWFACKKHILKFSIRYIQKRQVTSLLSLAHQIINGNFRSKVERRSCSKTQTVCANWFCSTFQTHQKTDEFIFWQIYWTEGCIETNATRRVRNASCVPRCHIHRIRIQYEHCFFRHCRSFSWREWHMSASSHRLQEIVGTNIFDRLFDFVFPPHFWRTSLSNRALDLTQKQHDCGDVEHDIK